MRLLVTCMACLEPDRDRRNEWVSVEVRDDGLYELTCSKGHTTVTAIQEQKFQILFDLGMMALLDGYPREAISSIAAALERFYEYYIRVVTLKHGTSHEQFEDAWRLVSKQSERQLGAFLLVYLMETGRPLTEPISNAKPDASLKASRGTWTEFRNLVTHEGYIPSSEEVLAYGDLVYKFMYRLIGELKATCGDFIRQRTHHHIMRAREHGDSTTVTTMSIPTLVSFRGSERSGNLRDALKGLDTYRLWLYRRDADRSGTE
jgi:hypothetical protein